MFRLQKMYRFVNTFEARASYYSIKDGDSMDSDARLVKPLKTVSRD